MNHPTRPTHRHTATGLTDAASQTEKNEDLTNINQVTFRNQATKLDKSILGSTQQ